MKKKDNSILAIPICTSLGMLLGIAKGNLTLGIAFGSLAGAVLACCGLFQNKDNAED